MLFNTSNIISPDSLPRKSIQAFFFHNCMRTVERHAPHGPGGGGEPTDPAGTRRRFRDQALEHLYASAEGVDARPMVWRSSREGVQLGGCCQLPLYLAGLSICDQLALAH